MAGKLQNGIKKFPRIDYKFTKKSYVPQECDYRKVLYKIVPQLKRCQTKLSLANQEFYTINFLAMAGYGFQTITSDLYSLGWCVYNYADRDRDPILRILQRHTYIMNPFNRQSLQFVKAKYKEQLNNLDCKSLIYSLNKTSFNDSLSCSGVSVEGIRQSGSYDSLYGNSSNGISSDSLDDVITDNSYDEKVSSAAKFKPRPKI